MQDNNEQSTIKYISILHIASQVNHCIFILKVGRCLYSQVNVGRCGRGGATQLCSDAGGRGRRGRRWTSAGVVGCWRAPRERAGGAGSAGRSGGAGCSGAGQAALGGLQPGCNGARRERTGRAAWVSGGVARGRRE
jgi:hypothetical protein